MCTTYTHCCRDPALELIAGSPETGSGSGAASVDGGEPALAGRCYTPHPGLATDVSASAEDPSSKKFCEYISGVSTSVTPASGVCDALGTQLSDFSLSECQENFCAYGVDGYADFLDKVVEFLRSNAMYLGGGLAVFVLLQCVLVANAWNLRARFRRRVEANGQVPYQQQEGVQHVPVKAQPARKPRLQAWGTPDRVQAVVGV